MDKEMNKDKQELEEALADLDGDIESAETELKRAQDSIDDALSTIKESRKALDKIYKRLGFDDQA